MGMELGLTLEITTSIMVEKKVLQLGEKLVLVTCICLEGPARNERITEEMAMRIALHEESLNAGLKIPMLLAMANLLRWYNLCLAQLVPKAWRAIVGIFSLMVHHCVEPKARVFHYFL